MYPTTQAYKDAIYQSSRVFKSRITLKIVDPNVDTRLNSTFFTISLSNFTSLNNKPFELVDGNRKSTHNYISFCQDKIKLGTSFSFLDNTVLNQGHLGIISTITSNSNKLFPTTKPSFFIEAITGQWVTLPLLGGCSVSFDTNNSQFAEAFRVVITNSLNATETITITGNTSLIRQVPFAARNVKKIEIIIDAWSHPNTRPRVQQIDLGLVLSYDNDKIMSFNLIEESDVHLATLPNSMFSFEVDNANLEWNPLDPNNNFAALKQNQKVEVEMGLVVNNEVEYVPVGVFYLREWVAKPKDVVAKFVAGGVLSKLESTAYPDKSTGPHQSLQTIATNIFTSAGITNYYIDPALNLSSKTIVGLSRGKNARDVLHFLCMLKNIKLRITRQNQIRLETNYDTIISDTIATASQKEDVDIETSLNPHKVIAYHYTTPEFPDGNGAYTLPNTTEGVVGIVEGNTFIEHEADAILVATQQANRLNLWRRKFIINFIGNPALELLDLVAVQNKYTTSTNIHLTKIEFSYNGFLFARAEGWAQV